MPRVNPRMKVEPSNDLNINIVIARKKAGMTQTDVVDALMKRGYYLTHMGYSGIEKRGKLFRLEFIKLLAEIFGVSPVFFFEKRSAIWDAGEAIKSVKKEPAPTPKAKTPAPEPEPATPVEQPNLPEPSLEPLPGPVL